MIDFSDTAKFSIPQMTGYNNEFSCTNSIHHIMRSHKIIPKSISPKQFFDDLGLGPIKDSRADDRLGKLAKSIIVENEIENEKDHDKMKTVTMINGVNIFVIERDCNDYYDVTLVQKGKIMSLDDKSVILMKEGAWYVPIYYNDQVTGKRVGLFEQAHPVIQKLLDEI